ncbi:MAG: hypothetical protein E7Z65_06300 [Thermoplasmata archaeon]|nr:hypothetical protein [Thermoplasmata archaeon]
MTGSYQAIYNDYHEIKVHSKEDGKKWVTLSIGNNEDARHRDIDMSPEQFDALILLMKQAEATFTPGRGIKE